MDTEDTRDSDLVAQLKRLDAGAAPATPGFDYDHMLQRHAAGTARRRRRLAFARGTASLLVVALVSVSAWRFQEGNVPPGPEPVTEPAPRAVQTQPRIVRADTYLPVAALED